MELGIDGTFKPLPGYQCRTGSELFWVLKNFKGRFLIIRAALGVTRALIVHIGSMEHGVGYSWQSVENEADLDSLLVIADATQTPVHDFSGKFPFAEISAESQGGTRKIEYDSTRFAPENMWLRRPFGEGNTMTLRTFVDLNNPSGALRARAAE